MSLLEDRDKENSMNFGLEDLKLNPTPANLIQQICTSIYQVTRVLQGSRQAVLRKIMCLARTRSLYNRRGCYKANKCLQTGEGKITRVWEAWQKTGNY